MILIGLNVQRVPEPDGGLVGLQIQAGRGAPKRWCDEAWQARMEFEAVIWERGWQ